MSDKILLVDDDAKLLELLGQYLQGQGYAAVTACTGPDALRAAYRERPDLVVLDVMLPGMDGWEVCARLRELTDLPIIILSARAAEADKLRGFRLGIDDYVTKPFSLPELAARINAVLMRTRRGQREAGPFYAAGNLTVDMDKRRVVLDGETVPLTPTEFRLLQCLIDKRGQPVSEAALAQEVWGAHRLGDTAVVRRYIWLLRQKLETDPAQPTRILTVRGFGYRLGTAPLDEDAGSPQRP